MKRNHLHHRRKLWVCFLSNVLFVKNVNTIVEFIFNTFSGNYFKSSPKSSTASLQSPAVSTSKPGMYKALIWQQVMINLQ